MTDLKKYYCKFCGRKFFPDKEGDACPICESIRKEPATRHFAEACEVRMIQGEFERPYETLIPIGRKGVN